MVFPKKLHRYRPNPEPALETQITKTRTKPIPCDPRSIEYGVRRNPVLLAQVIGGDPLMVRGHHFFLRRPGAFAYRASARRPRAGAARLRLPARVVGGRCRPGPDRGGGASDGRSSGRCPACGRCPRPSIPWPSRDRPHGAIAPPRRPSVASSMSPSWTQSTEGLPYQVDQFLGSRPHWLRGAFPGRPLRPSLGRPGVANRLGGKHDGTVSDPNRHAGPSTMTRPTSRRSDHSGFRLV